MLFRSYFPRKTIHPAHDVEYPAAFKELGYAVRYERAGFPAFYRKLEDLVFLLLVTPWDIADLDLEADAAALLAVERDLSTPLGIELTEGRYLLEARKPR